MAAEVMRLPSLEEFPMVPSSASYSSYHSATRPRSSTYTSVQLSTSSTAPLHRRMSTALKRVSKDLDRTKKEDLTRSSGHTKYVPPPPLEPQDPALAASRLAWNQHPQTSEGERYYETTPVRGSGYARYPTTKPTTLRVEEHKVKGFRAVWRDFILNLRMKLYRLRKQMFGRTT